MKTTKNILALFAGLLFTLGSQPNAISQDKHSAPKAHEYPVFSRGYVAAHKGRALGEEAGPFYLNVGANEEPEDIVTPIACIAVKNVTVYNMSNGANMGQRDFRISSATWEPDKKRVAVTWITSERNTNMDVKEYYIDLTVTMRYVKK